MIQAHTVIHLSRLKKLMIMYAVFTLSLHKLQLHCITTRQVLIWTVLVYSCRVKNSPNKFKYFTALLLFAAC